MTGALVAVGTFGAAHGVRGEIRLKSFTADPAGIARLAPLCDAAGKRFFNIRLLRPLKSGVFLARVVGVDDRSAAEALAGLELYVPRDRLPAPEADEFYHADLIGLRVESRSGEVVGRVVAVQNFGAGDLLEIAPVAGRDTVLLPFTSAVVPSIDLAGGRILVVPPAEVEAGS